VATFCFAWRYSLGSAIDQQAQKSSAASPKPTPGLSSNRKAIDNSLSPAILLASEKKVLEISYAETPD
jgi:hypothetical protein